jgi:hypothetical protein
MRVSNYSLTFRINQSKRQERFRKPIALFVDPTILSGAPYTGSGEIGYTPFRKRAVVPSGCLMYKIRQNFDNTEKIDIINIKGLPYEFVRLILHGDYDYREDDNLSYLINMHLYNDRLRAFTQTNIQQVQPTDLPKCENVYYLLNHAAKFIQNSFFDNNGNIKVDVKQEIERYRVVFLYDNIDDYNSYLFVRHLILLDSDSASWGILVLRKSPDDDALSPFSNIIHFTRQPNTIPHNYTDNYMSFNLSFHPVSSYADFSTAHDKIFLNYKTGNGITSFTQNSLNGLRDNLDFTYFPSITFDGNYLNSIILYLDYNPMNDNASTHDELRLLGFGFITQSAGENIEEPISILDPIVGRESITNTDGILYEHTLLTAFLRFIILYKYLGYDILCYITYKEDVKDFKNISTIDYVQKSLIYRSGIITAKTKLEEKEEEGFIMLKRNDKILIAYKEEHNNYVDLSFDTIYQFGEIIELLSRNRIRLVYADKNTKEIIEGYFNNKPNSKIVFNVNRYPSYRHDPMYVTNNSGTLGNRRYVEFLSDYYPLYWYYDGTSRVPDVGNLSGISVIDEYFYNLHPCVLIYGNSARYPTSKRQVRVRWVKHLADKAPDGNPYEYNYSGVTYIEIKDPVELNSNIWIRLILTQREAILPLDLDSLTSSQEEVAPPVINLDYMSTPIQNFIGGNLISSRDILEYPIIPDETTPISEIDTNTKVYYREVLYWKYLRYLINVGIVRYYFYNLDTWSAPDIVSYKVRAINDTTNNPATEITLGVLFYDNRIINSVEIQINIST